MKNYDFDPRTDLDTYGPENQDRRTYAYEYIEGLVRNGGRIDSKSQSLDEQRTYVEGIIVRIRKSIEHVQTNLMSPGNYPELSSDFLAGMLRGLHLCIAMYEGDKVEINNLQILRELEEKIRGEIENAD